MESHCKSRRALRDLYPRYHLAIILLTVMFVEEGSSQVCPASHKQCLSGSPTCIPFSERCNGINNCQDGSDEFYCNPANISYALIWSTMQLGSNFGQLFVLYGDPDAYRGQIELNETFGQSVAALALLRTELGYNFQALESDFSAYGFFFSDGLSQNVGFGDIVFSQGSFINVIPASDSVTGLSIDWVTGLLYWSDARYKRIGVMSSNTWLTWAPIVEDGLNSPQDVVVYPQESFLFWSDVGNVSKIERLDLTNGVRQVIVSNADLQRPTTLVIDFDEGRLLFLDSMASRIGSVHLDGSNMTFWYLDLFSRVSSFSLFKGYIFLGDMKQATSYVYNFTQQTYVGSVSANIETGIIDLTVYEKAKQPAVASPCNSNNGDCDHFCITINATSRICKCAMGYFLNPDGTTCGTQVLTDNFLLVADLKQENILQVDITSGEVRVASKMPSGGFWPTTMDYDPQTTDIYVFDNYTYTIRRITISTQTNSLILDTQGAPVLGIALDTVGRLLYYIDGFQKVIVQLTLSGAISQTVFSEPNTDPEAIALDVRNRFIFWSNCYQRSSSSIEQANITSFSNHHSVVSGLYACPTAIAVDSLYQVIYWGDTAGVIKNVGYDGRGQSLVYDGSSSATTGYAGLALDETFLYISNPKQTAIQRLNRATSQLSNLTALRFVGPQAIVFYSSIMPTKTTTTASAAAAGITSAPGTDSSTKIIVACVVTIPVVLILVIITIVLVKKFRRNSSKSSDSGNYDTIGDQQLKTFDSGTQNQGSDQHEGLQNDYLHLPGQRESLPADYLHLSGQRESLPNDYLHLKGQRESLPADYLHLSGQRESLPADYLHLKGQRESLPADYLHLKGQRESLPDDYLCPQALCESLPNDYLHLQGQGESLPNEYLYLEGQHETLPDDGYLRFKTDAPSSLPEQMFHNVGKENESPPTHVSFA